ncbi:MAG: hypothetical protein ACKOXB_11470 [Flavobacteriales bacterium]
MKAYLFVGLAIMGLMFSCKDELEPNQGDLQRIVRFNRLFLNSYREACRIKYENWPSKNKMNMAMAFFPKDSLTTFKDLFENKIIKDIDLCDAGCVMYKLAPDYNNNLFKSEWTELWFVYYTKNSFCLCHKRINGMDVKDDQIEPYSNSWFIVKAKGKRYIGG